GFCGGGVDGFSSSARRAKDKRQTAETTLQRNDNMVRSLSPAGSAGNYGYSHFLCGELNRTAVHPESHKWIRAAPRLLSVEEMREGRLRQVYWLADHSP